MMEGAVDSVADRTGAADPALQALIEQVRAARAGPGLLAAKRHAYGLVSCLPTRTNRKQTPDK